MLVKRDTFARTELHRENVYSSQDCAWCGRYRTNKSGKAYLYKYRTETDGGRTYEHSGLFCSKTCRDCYHGK